MNTIEPKINAIQPDLIKLRKEFHRIPEPGFQEHRTAAKVAAHLD